MSKQIYINECFGETLEFAESLGFDSDACEEEMIIGSAEIHGVEPTWESLPDHERCSISDALEEGALEYIRSKGWTIVDEEGDEI